ncbi:replication initiator protein A [Aerococcaceae bacterium NML191292]|nr:replication initiator protein A [Aerococcaceae bacterium NML191292]
MTRGRMKRSYIVAIQEFYQLPKILFISPKYIDLSLEAKVMFSFFYSRTLLSEKRNFVDEENNVYFFYKNEDLIPKLGCSKTKVIAAKRELIKADLLDEVKTGRASRLYLKHLDLEGVSSSDLEDFDAPVLDETKISDEEKQLRQINAKNQWVNQKNKRRYRLINRMHEVQNRTFVHKMFHRKMHEVQNQPLMHSSPSNQHSSKQEKCTKSKIEPSEVQNWYPRYTELDRVDNNKDYLLDQRAETEQNVLNKDFLLKEQYLADMSREYSSEIMSGVKFASEYEDLTMLNRVLKNAMDDIFKGKPYAYKEASEHIQSISAIIGQLGYYHSPEISIAVKNAIVRATRFAYSGKKSIENSASYYYAAIQKAIINYVVDNYELTSNNPPSIHEANEGYMRG